MNAYELVCAQAEDKSDDTDQVWPTVSSRFVQT